MSESKLNDAGVQYLWSKIKAMFALKTDVPSPATNTPGMDSVSGQVGASLKYAREDHTHPKDSSKANVASPTFTGVPSAPTPATGTASTQIATTAFVANSIAANNSVELPKKQNVLDAGRNITLTQLSTGHVRIDGVDLTPLWNLLNDKVDDILVNGNSIVSTLTSGEKIASMTLQAGTNISIVRDGNVFRINNTASGGTGDVTLHTGINEPSSDLGTNHDIYLRLSTTIGGRLDVPPAMGSGGAYRSFNYIPDLTNKVFNFWVIFYDSWEYHSFLTFRYDNLTVGKTYRISFNYKTDETPVLYGVGELYGATIQYTSSCIDGRNVSGMVTGGEFKHFTDTYYGNFEYQSFIEDNQLHTYTFDFVAESSTVYFGMYGDRINMNALQVNCTGIVIGEVEEGNEIEDVYYKVNGEWLLYDRDEVEANPSDPATDQLDSIRIGDKIYDLGGGNVADVYVNGTSVLDENDIAQVFSHEEITESNYDNLPSTKFSDNHMYLIKEAGTPPTGEYYNPVIYSEEEREIGVWINDKPLYQFVAVTNGTISLTNYEYKNIPLQYTPPNIETLISGVITGETPNVGGTLRFYADNGVIQGASVNNYNLGAGLIIIFQYTKTTDTAGSGQYNHLGVPTVHYSTDEQIVGTWIDGKPLYQKTFDLSVSISSTSRTWYIVLSASDVQAYHMDKIFIDQEASYAIDTDDGTQYPIPYSSVIGNAGGLIGWAVTEGAVKLCMANISTGTMLGKMTLRYTKTTD